MTFFQKPVRCLLLDDDALDLAYTRYCLEQHFGAPGVQVVHVSTIEDAEAALSTTKFDVAVLDYFVGPRTPMSLLRHFDDLQSACVVLVLSSVHPSIVTPFLDAVGQGSFLDKTTFCASALSRALTAAGLTQSQAQAAMGSEPRAVGLSASADIA